MTVTVKVELQEFFGHYGLLLYAEGWPTRFVSLADPRGAETLARILTELAASEQGGKEDP